MLHLRPLPNYIALLSHGSMFQFNDTVPYRLSKMISVALLLFPGLGLALLGFKTIAELVHPLNENDDYVAFAINDLEVSKLSC